MILNELKHKAISLLAIKDYTSLEMITKLSKYGEDEDVEEVITFLVKKNLINDNVYGMNYYEYQLSQGHGYVWIKNKLLQKGIVPQYVEQLREEYESQERDVCIKYAHKLLNQLKSMSKQAMKQTVEQKLKQRGFSLDKIYEVTSSLIFEEDTQALLIEYDKAIKKYYKEGNEMIRQRKIISYLQRKGYRYDDILKMIRSG